MNQFEFNQLLEKYMAGQCSEQEEALILDWYKQTVDTSQISLPTAEKEQIKQTIWTKIKANTLDLEVAEPKTQWTSLAVAAIVLLSFGAIWFYFSKKNDIKTPPSVNQAVAVAPLKEIKNTSEKPQNVNLEDGTMVVLQAHSTLSFPEHFAPQNRTVYLTGEALFKVKRLPNQPFLVYAGDLVTEVLGTSFIVKTNTKTTEVRVLSGKVSVYENKKETDQNRKGTILTPNHKATYNADSQQLTPSVVEAPIVVNAPKSDREDFEFEDTALPKVLDILKKRYALEFIIGNTDLNNCLVSGDFNDLPMFKQLDWICQSISAKYEVRGTTIFINGEGCK